MDLEQTTAALVAGALTGLAVWLRDRRAERLRHAVPAAATAQIKQAQILTELRAQLGGVRALLIKVHDGGQVPHGGRDLKITALAESDPLPGVPAIAAEIQGRPILDREYLRLIHDLDREHVLLIRTADLRPGGLLRDEHERAGVSSAWAVLVLAEPERWYFALVEARHVMGADGASRAVLRSAAARLARLCVRQLEITLVDDTY